VLVRNSSANFWGCLLGLPAGTAGHSRCSEGRVRWHGTGASADVEVVVNTYSSQLQATAWETPEVQLTGGWAVDLES
jgi:hypothetical protein